jgi:hypothetical protein
MFNRGRSLQLRLRSKVRDFAVKDEFEGTIDTVVLYWFIAKDKIITT